MSHPPSAGEMFGVRKSPYEEMSVPPAVKRRQNSTVYPPARLCLTLCALQQDTETVESYYIHLYSP